MTSNLLDPPTPMNSTTNSPTIPSAALAGPGATRARSPSPVVITEPDMAIDDRFDQSSFDSSVGMTSPDWSFQARKRTSAELEALAPQAWEASGFRPAIDSDVANSKVTGAPGSSIASRDPLDSTKSFASDRTYDDKDHNNTDVDCDTHDLRDQERGDTRTASSISAVDSGGPTRQPTPRHSEERLRMIEHEPHTPDAVRTGDHSPIRAGNCIPSAWHAANEHEYAALTSQYAQDQARIDRLMTENQSLRCILAIALDAKDSTKTSSSQFSGPPLTALPSDAPPTLILVERRLKTLTGLAEAERESRARIVDLYDQELQRMRGGMAATISFIDDTRDAVNGLARRISQLGSPTTCRTAGRFDNTVLLSEEKAKRNALSGLLVERLAGLSKSLRESGLDALHHSFVAAIDELDATAEMQKQGFAKKAGDLSEAVKLLATDASSKNAGRKASMHSRR